ncbi:uncharacterized protein LOC111129638 [Crassostrea virginica]
MSRKRNPNFSENELQVLLDEVEKNKSQKRVWDVICEKINACNASGHIRTVEEIRKKFSSYTSETKKKIAQNRKESARTGGGRAPATDLTPLQEKVSEILGDTPIDGIEGGVDTAESSTSTSRDKEISCECPSSSPHEEPYPAEIPPAKKARRSSFDEKVFDIETQKVEIERQRLSVERERLQIERERLGIEQQRFVMEQQRHTVYLAQRGVCFDHSASATE